MKSMHQTDKHVSMAIVLGIFLFLFNSCSQDNNSSFGMDESAETYTGEAIPIVIGNVGIEYFGSSAVTRSGETKVMSAYREPLDDDYDIISEVESFPESEQPVTRGNLGNTVRFRIVAYKNNAVSTANYVGQADYYINGTGGVPALVSGSKALLLRPGSYKFVCYSFNTNTLATFNGTSATTVPVSHGQDFLSCVLDNVIVTIEDGGQFTLPTINFRRMCSQVQIIVNSANGENITACSARVTGLNSNQNYTVGTAELPATGTGGTVNVSWSSLPASIANSNFQCILPNSSRTITISLTFTIGGTAYSNKTFTLANRVFAGGSNYKVTVSVKKNYVIISGFNYKVAMGNVIKVGNTYKMQATQGNYSGVWNGGDYFNWSCSDPNNTSYKASSFSVDICRNMGSQWRTPNQTEMQQLANCKKVRGNYPGTNRGTVAGDYYGTSSAPEALKKDNFVFFPFSGYRNSNSTSMADLGGAGDYWTSTITAKYAIRLHTFGGNNNVGENSRMRGMPVRCIANK